MKPFTVILSLLLASALALMAGTVQSQTCPTKAEAYADAVGRLPDNAIQKSVSYSNLYTECEGGKKKENWVCIITYDISRKSH